MSQSTQQSVSLEAAAKIMLEAEVEEVNLCKCQVSHHLKDDELPDHLDNKIQSSGQISKQHNALVIIHHLGLLGTYVGKNAGGEPPLVIEAVYGIHYTVKWKEKISEEHIERFARTVSLYHVWPYWREFVQSMITRMGMPPLTIPVLNFAKPKKKELVVKGKKPARRAKKKS